MRLRKNVFRLEGTWESLIRLPASVWRVCTGRGACTSARSAVRLRFRANKFKSGRSVSALGFPERYERRTIQRTKRNAVFVEAYRSRFLTGRTIVVIKTLWVTDIYRDASSLKMKIIFKSWIVIVRVKSRIANKGLESEIRVQLKEVGKHRL